MFAELVLIVLFRISLSISPNTLMCIFPFRDTSFEDDDDEVRILRERRPNAGNRTELLQLMSNTREDRRLWIKAKSPSITDVLNKYPRFQDIDTAVSIFMLEMKTYLTTELQLESKQHFMLSL